MTSEFVPLSAEIFTSPLNSSAAWVVFPRGMPWGCCTTGPRCGRLAVPCASDWSVLASSSELAFSSG
ncbi:hypothetical protein COSO111634_38410 [Corallococcus soli]